MKRKTCFILGLIGILVLSGFSSQPDAVTEKDVVQEETETPEEYVSYKSILDSTYDIISAANIDVAADDETIGLLESASGDTEEALANIGYCMTDIDEDGICELLIVNNREADSRILSIYTLDEKDQTPLFLVGGWIRNRYYLTSTNSIVNIGSGGADYTIYRTYEIGEDPKAIVPKESYFTDYKDDAGEQLGWFYSTAGSLEKSESEWLGDAYDEALTAEIENKYADHAVLDLIYFKDYQK